MSDYLKNCWYMAAWSEEVTDKPLGQTILEKPVVIFRGEGGRPVGLGGMCPHRFAPLSKGAVKGDTISCAYHGLKFDAKGDCVESPFGIDVPKGCRVPAYVMAEKHDVLWIWMGDPDLADEGKIPDFAYHCDPGMRVVRGRSKVPTNYELIADNLMDLTHARFLHPIFGGDDWRPSVSFSQDGDIVFSHYELPPYPPSPFSDAIMPPSQGRLVVEREYMRWQAPANMYLDIQFSWADTPGENEVPQPSSHLLTPEGRNSTHYFWASGILNEAAMTDEEHYEGLRFAFDEEDAPMLEAVQQMMDGRDFWELQPAILAFDQGAVRARRVLRQKIKAENAAPEPAAQAALAAADT